LQIFNNYYLFRNLTLEDGEKVDNLIKDVLADIKMEEKVDNSIYVHSAKVLLLPPKCEIIMVLSKCFVFQ
jgi:hypothetical protein